MWRPWMDDNQEEILEQEHQNEPSTSRSNFRLPAEAKEIVKNVYDGLCSKLPKSEAIKETVFLTQVPRSTVYAIINKEVTPRKKRCDSGQFRVIESHLLEPISKTIYEMYSANNFPTIESLRTELIRKNILQSCSQMTLRRFVKANGFKYKKIDKRRSIMESSRILSLRNDYIRAIGKYREEGRNIVYLDETWYDTHDTIKKSWTNDSKLCKFDVPCNKGKRIIILHCGGEKGWIDDALLLSAKNIKDSSLDYHDDMDSNLFEAWFEKTLIPKLSPHTVIVLDNAPYHSRLQRKIPNMNSLKSEIQDFLVEEDLYFDEKYTKKQLIEVLNTRLYEKVYFVDHCAELNGHTVLRLPPYYCVLNPIELIWAQLKDKVRRTNVAPKFSASVLDLIKEQVKTIGESNWQAVIKHVIKIEEEYKKCLVVVNNIIINLQDNDESDINTDNESDIDD